MAIRRTNVTGKRLPPFKGSGLTLPKPMITNQGSPTFPGWQQPGATQKSVQNFNKNMVRRKGFRFSGGTSPEEFALKISGTAKFLLGIAFLNSSFGVCSMMLNNEQVFETMDTGFFQLGQTNQDYYAINRPLSGQDDCTLTITGDAAYVDKSFVIYYF
jgi:hypothetical protein